MEQNQEPNKEKQSQSVSNIWCNIEIQQKHLYETNWFKNFRCKYLESTFLSYSYRQRRLGVTVVISVALLLQVSLLYSGIVKENYFRLGCYCSGIVVNVIVLLLLYLKKHFEKRHLQWASLYAWLLFMTFSVFDVLQDIETKRDLLWYGIWYSFSTVFIPFTILPLSVLWSTILGSIATVSHIVLISIELYTEDKPSFVSSNDDNFCSIQRIIAHSLFYIAVNFIGIYIKYLTDKGQRKVFLEILRFLESQNKTRQENDKQEKLLFSIFPDFIAREMIFELENEQRRTSFSQPQQFHKMFVQKYNYVSILFADIQKFTELASVRTAQEIVKSLNDLFATFDKLAMINHCLRIKLVGDCYNCVSGLPTPRPDHAQCCVEMGLAMIKTAKKIKTKRQIDLNLRVGIHSGSVLCGVLGLRKWQFDIWSEDVRIANSMESCGKPGKVHISETTYKFLNGKYAVEEINTDHSASVLQEHNLTTYIIKEEEPLPSDLEDDRNQNKKYVTNEWIPEIPFKDLRRLLSNDSKQEYTYSHKKEEFELETEANTCKEIEKSLKSQKSVLNRFTLTYLNKETEKQYVQMENDIFKSNIFCYLIIWVLIIACQLAIIQPDLSMIIVFPLTTVILICIALMLKAKKIEKCPNLIKKISTIISCNRRRKSVLVGIFLIIMSLACSSSLSTYDNNGPQPHPSFDGTCSYPEYVVFAWTTCLISVAAALRFYFLIKIVLAFLMMAAYTILVTWRYESLFISNDENTFHFITIRLAILQLAFFCMILYHSRLVELTSRLYFLWQQKAETEMKDMEATRHINMLLLTNVLPDHVAQHFLREKCDNEELYSQSKDNVGVLFATIPNFNELYLEGKSLENLRLLNEIIANFDELLDEERFSSIEKIKTISVTPNYMAVSGLNSVQKDPIKHVTSEHLCALIDFAIAMRQRLEEINTDSFNKLSLRVGISYGSLVCGVIGAKKPIFDVWGDTVNEASRMDSTGIAGHIQVTKNIAQLLLLQGYEMRKRGVINVKGKGLMDTYFIIGKKVKRVRSCQRILNHFNDFGVILHAIAQNRKKFQSHTYRV